MRDFLHKVFTVYLDDLCVYYCRTMEEHLEHVHFVLKHFNEEGLKLRLKKLLWSSGA
jgi:hypothetical protein